MRRILGVLRDDGVDDGGPELVPQPSLASIAELVAGDPTLPSRYVVDGDLPGSIPPSIELSAYRIVQEALTNVRKHAGTVRRVRGRHRPRRRRVAHRDQRRRMGRQFGARR